MLSKHHQEGLPDTNQNCCQMKSQRSSPTLSRSWHRVLQQPNIHQCTHLVEHAGMAAQQRCPNLVALQHRSPAPTEIGHWGLPIAAPCNDSTA